MNAAPVVPRPNTRDMLGIHQVFRDAFGFAPQLVGSVCNDHPDRVDAVASYYANVLAFLRAHHEGEDELIWPKLIERAPEHAELMARMQSDDAGLLDALAESERRLAAWQSVPDIDRGASLAAALATLGVLCAAHFDEEERKVLPLAAEVCTQEEWAELPAHAMRSFTGDRLWLIIGLVEEQRPVDARAEMEAKMPTPVLQMWQAGGQAQYEQFISALRS